MGREGRPAVEGAAGIAPHRGLSARLKSRSEAWCARAAHTWSRSSVSAPSLFTCNTMSCPSPARGRSTEPELLEAVALHVQPPRGRFAHRIDTMVSPYREVLPTTLVEDANEDAPLASIVVSGRTGQRGRDGADGAAGSGYGAHGQDGRDAGPAERGQDAGEIRLGLSDTDGLVILSGEQVSANGEQRPIRHSFVSVTSGFIELRALGGTGGHGGHGGVGGNGAGGRSGSDATRWSRGGDGGPGGDGGDGGNATSGADGGSGGAITVEVSDADTPLLMLVDHDVSGGEGGAPGRNGAGGAGGSGGRGGDSYSWTETESYTDSNGDHQTRSTYHSNPGGSRGPSGRQGRSGNARVSNGARGNRGRFEIRVATESGVKSYASRYDLRLVQFRHDSLNQDCVYEPGELARVFGIVVKNVGGMPTPAKDDLQLSLVAKGWVLPEPGELLCPPGLAPNVCHEMAGELTFRIKEFEPTSPGDPLEAEESILHRALLPSVHRAFADYQRLDALKAGAFVVRFPVRTSEVRNLRSLAAGDATRIKFTLVNQSRLALGARSDTKRVVRARIATAADSELDDEHVRFLVDGKEILPSEGWTFDIDVLGAGEEMALELALRVGDDAPEYRRYAGMLTLEIGRLDEPARPKTAQLRALDVRVARPFRTGECDLLLVVNHRTTREEVAAWEALASELAVSMAIWDLSLERHLDLEIPVADGKTLRDLIGRGSIAILDNEIDGSDGPTYPHAFLCPHQALRAAQTGIDIAYFGKGLALEQALVPVQGESVTHEVCRRYWLRFWAKPNARWLARRAAQFSERLAIENPEQRHIVVHRFEPRVISSFLWMKRWRVGTLETRRTLDTAEGALIRVALSDETLHDPAFAISPDATTALLLLLDFDAKLERLRKLGAGDSRDPLTIDRVVDLLLCDLADEVAAVFGAGSRIGRDQLGRLMPRLAALSASQLRAQFGTPLGDSLVRLASGLLFLAQSQIRLVEHIPPVRWTRRSPAVAAHIRDHIDEFLMIAFGAHNLKLMREQVRAGVKGLRFEHKVDGRGRSKPSRRDWALERFRQPLAAQHITSDVEVLTTPAGRVLAEAEYTAISDDKARQTIRRGALQVGAARAHDDLVV
ncbi:MAG: hypothetical protein HOV81_00110 [Kofleriaceae bacterium]|nr:hypothetical protein [Kofleriaceae bacterium]